MALLNANASLARTILDGRKRAMPGYFEVVPATRESHPHIGWRDYDRVQQLQMNSRRFGSDPRR